MRSYVLDCISDGIGILIPGTKTLVPRTPHSPTEIHKSSCLILLWKIPVGAEETLGDSSKFSYPFSGLLGCWTQDIEKYTSIYSFLGGDALHIRTWAGGLLAVNVSLLLDLILFRSWAVIHACSPSTQEAEAGGLQ